jgi:hypothetical protein
MQATPVNRPSTVPLAIVLIAALAGTLGGCAVPDRPPRLPDALPGALLDAFPPDTVRTESVAPGVHHHFVWAPEGPFAMHVLEIDRIMCELGLEVGVPPDVDPGEGGFARVSTMAAGHPRAVVAAVNGDFFSAAGLPVGVEAGPLGVRASGGAAALAVRDGREPWVGWTSIDQATGAVVGPDWMLDPANRRDVQVIGGLPELLDLGARVGDLEVSARPSFAAARHPRSAIGFDDDRIWIVTVDGRREGYSAGMTLPELARVFEALGAREALNLDGGGSTVMVVDGRVVSRPSDPTGEREVVNALLLVTDPTLCL